MTSSTPQNQTVIAHCDANSFYCSCHRVFEPLLLNRPVGVLSNNDGCIIARTSELKAMNIAMGTPFFQVKNLMHRGEIIIRSSNYPLYGDMSARFMAVLETFSPEVEVYSIDEAFLRFEGFQTSDWHKQGQAIQHKVGQWTGLPIGVGLATTKVLAKLANYAAKHYSATGGVVDLTSESRQKKLMAITPVGEIWGIGRRLKKRLQEEGLETVLDFANLSPKRVRQRYSITEEKLVRELRGESCLEWESEPALNKDTIMCSRSFGQTVTTERELHEAMATYVSRACEKLRAQNKQAQRAMVFIRSDPFRDDTAQYDASRQIDLPWPSHSTRTWLAQAQRSLTAMYREGIGYKKAGFVLMGIHDQSLCQHDLFQEGAFQNGAFQSKPEHSLGASNTHSDQLMNVLDTINNRFGKGTLHSAATGVQPARWHMNQNFPSPCFTTRWKELVTVRS